MPQQDPQSWIQLTVQELLSLPVFASSKVLGGSAGLSRQVVGINLSDSPDYGSWLSPDELMITTCYAIYSDDTAVDALIPTAAAAGLSGVCIKLNKYFTSIPQSMADSADKLGIPLIELSETTNLSQITKSVSDLILRRQTEFLKRVLSANELLIKLIVEGATLDEIAAMLSELVESPVLIIDAINNRRALSLTRSSRLAFLGMGANESDIVRLITENSHVQPLYVESRTFGYLYIYDAAKPLSPINQGIIERIALTIPLEIARERSIRETENVHFKDFLLHILNDKMLDEEKEIVRARSFGIEPSNKHIVLRASIRSTTDSSAQYAAILQRTFLYNELRTHMQELSISVKLTKINDRYILLLSAPVDSGAFNGITKLLKDIGDKLRTQYPALTLSVGFGRGEVGLRGIAKSGEDAQTALRVCETMYKNGGVICFDEIGLFRLIYAQDPEAETAAYINETIGSLIASEKSRSAELLATLESYFNNFGNLKRVSEETFTHYNTVVYRLKSIREITGFDVRDPNERFRLEVALKLYKLLTLEKSNFAITPRDTLESWEGNR